MADSRLAESWAKLDWAKAHVDCLRRGVGELADGEDHRFELRCDYEAERRAFVYRVGSKPKIPDDAGLIAGDAIQNFRSALNYVAWQLAIDFLGHEPTVGEAGNVQFPIVDKSSKEPWGTHRHRRYMSADAANAIQEFQPFDIETKGGAGEDSPLAILGTLSNGDKHKILQVVILAPSTVQITLDRMEPPGSGVVISGEYREGDEVAAVGAPSGSEPDVNREPKLFGKATFRKPRWPLIPALDAVGATCTEILCKVEPLLKAAQGP